MELITIAPSIRNVTMIAVSLLVIAIVLPLGLGYIASSGDTLVNGTALSELVDPAVITLLTVMIPILAVIGIALAYISYSRG